MKGRDIDECIDCNRPSCIYPNICHNLDVNHDALTDVYESVSSHPDVKKAFVGSGIRYDLLVDDSLSKKDRMSADRYIEILAKRHVSGRLKVAPEHTSEKVLKLMRKPSFSLFYKFKQKFEKQSKEMGLNQEVIPYFISSHPGSETLDMADMAIRTKKLGFKLEQVQDLTPTPMTVAAVIFYSGFHPYSLKPVFTEKNPKEKLNQRKFFFWYKGENKQYIQSALKKIGKSEWINELISSGKTKVKTKIDTGNFKKKGRKTKRRK
jgi:uncharacterized radical SAM protein YgiQ